MAITFNTGTTSTSGNSTQASLNITIPGGVAAGDVLIVVFSGFGAAADTVQASSTGTAPVLIGSSQSTPSFSSHVCNSAIFSIVASATDAGKVITGSLLSGGTVQWAAGLGAWTGVLNSAPVDVNAAATASGASATITCPSATTGTAGDWDIQIVGAALGGSSFTGGGGFTQREAFSDPSSGCTVLIYDSNASVGGSGTSIGGAAFSNAGNNNWWVGYTVGLTPAVAPPPPPAVTANNPESGGVSGWIMLPVRGRIGSAVLLSPGRRGGMAWSLVQSASTTQSTNNVATLAATYSTANLTAGTKLIAVVTVAGNSSTAVTTSTVKDGAGNSFTKVSSIGLNGSTLKGELSLWAMDTPAGDAGTKPTITATFSVATNNGCGILIEEVSGLATGNTLAAMVDGTAGTSSGSAGSSTTSPTYSSTALNEYLVSCVGDDGASAACTYTKPANLTLDTNSINSNGASDVLLANKNSANGAESESWTRTTQNNDWATILVAFKLPTAGAAPFYPFRQAVRARQPLIVKIGTSDAELAKATGNISGPVNWLGGGSGASGALVKNPTQGPSFRQAVQAIRARLPQGSIPSPGLTGAVTSELAKGTGNVAGPVTWHGSGSGASGATVKNPTSGPVFYQSPQPCQSRIPQNIQPVAERISSNRGSAPHNPTQGPVFRQANHAINAIYNRTLPPRGQCYSNPGAPVRNPNTGPVFRQRVTPVRFILPPPQPRAGRIGSAPGGPVINPKRGPPVYPLLSPVQIRQPLPLRGRVNSSRLIAALTQGPAFFAFTQAVRAKAQPFARGWNASNRGAPVKNPTRGPVFRQATSPTQARIPQNAPRGRVYSNPGAKAFIFTGPPFQQAVQAIRSRLPLQPFLKGRTAGNKGAPVSNPASGPVFRQATQAIRIRPSLPPRGRIGSNKGAPLKLSSSGPPVYGQIQGAAPTQWAGRSRAGSSASSPVVNPTQGPVFRQATQPVRAKGTLPPRGRVTVTPKSLPPPVVTTGPPVYGQAPGAAVVRWAGRGRSGAGANSPVVNPVKGAAFPPWHGPVRARQLPQRGGRIYTTGPTSRSPNVVTVTGSISGAVRAALPVNLRGTVSSNRGAPVVQHFTGPPFRQATQPIRIRPSLPPRGRIASGKGAFNTSTAPLFSSGQPLGIRVVYLYTGRARSTPPPYALPKNPTQGPPFRQAVRPAQARQPLPIRGRIASNPGAPVVISTTGPAFFPFRQAVHIRFTLPPRGTVRKDKGAPVKNPTSGPQFRQLPRPVQARQPLPPRGRTYSNPGGPVHNTGPQIPQRGQPFQQRIPQTWSKGRVYSNPGTPVIPPAVGPKFIQRHDPVRIRPSLPPRGTVASNKGAPVRNPTTGPKFRQAIQPIRPRIPQNAPRGRTSGNKGGPVQNIPINRAVFSSAQPFTDWSLDLLFTKWQAGKPFTDWDSGLLFTDWQAGKPFTDWVTGVPYIIQ